MKSKLYLCQMEVCGFANATFVDESSSDGFNIDLLVIVRLCNHGQYFRFRTWLPY